MELVATPTAVFTFGVMAALCVAFTRYLPLGILSLPSMTLLTSIVYYYVMPGLAFSGSNAGFLGVYIDSMEWIHWAVLLYALGVTAACFLGRRRLRENPAAPRPYERPLNSTAFWILVAVAAVGLVTLALTNRLNLMASEDFTINEASGEFAFLQLTLSMLLPLTIIYAVRENFGPRALLVIAVVAFVFLVSGFRFRIAILMIAVAASYCLTRGLKIGAATGAIGITVALMVFNAIGHARRYGVGLDFSNLDGIQWSELLSSFGGEVGPIFALFGVIQYPPSELILADPWIVAIARLVPSFIWPDKPYPDYLFYYSIAFDDITRRSAGIAGPQQAEMLLQFGWPGLLFLPFIYFLIVIYISTRISRLGREARIAGAALLPGICGFYMQQRGYFFQNLCEILFIIGPLFLVNYGQQARAVRVENAPRA